jgi:hypothetical protein
MSDFHPKGMVASVLPYALAKEEETQDPLSTFKSLNKSWTNKAEVEIVKLLKVDPAIENNKFQHYIGKYVAVESTMIRKFEFEGETHYFVELRYIYGIVE